MIVPMKKVSLIIPGDRKSETLRTLRKLGALQIEICEGSGEKLGNLKERITLLESALYTVGKSKNAEVKTADTAEALAIAEEVASLSEEKKACLAEQISLSAELDRLKAWGEVDPSIIASLAKDGVKISLFETPLSEYDALDDSVKTLCLSKSKASVRFILISENASEELEAYRLALPQASTVDMKQRISALSERMNAIDEKIASFAGYAQSFKNALHACEKEIEFETFSTGMAEESFSSDVSVAYFKGYIEAEKLDCLKETAKANAWGLLAEDPTEEDNVPTKLKNNKFVSLLYPLTDFLGTIPGYFEYDISAWFLSFILIFFGIIFGDGGYGLLICAIALIPILSALLHKKSPAPAFLLVGLFGLSTVLWGTLTCTWFGLSPEQLPQWLKSLSIPIFSNVYADKLWYPFWTNGEAGLTTAQNLQIFCFTLALVQLVVAHIKGAMRHKSSLKVLSEFGSILQLVGMYYVVLSVVVNAEVFSFGLVIAGIPIGTLSIALIGIGFLLSFVFANYEGSVIKSILNSLTNIVSVLLGVVNVFSDIVSYIRLWAVGLSGAAISATVNELAGPLFGNFLFMVLAIFLLVFGHGLNIILNVLSVIVHGIRLNTLEFSSHLDMAWSGYKFKPFEE